MPLFTRKKSGGGSTYNPAFKGHVYVKRQNKCWFWFPSNACTRIIASPCLDFGELLMVKCLSISQHIWNMLSTQKHPTALINHVGRTWLIHRIAKKTKWPPVECIKCQTLISPPKRKLQHLWRPTYGLLTMAKLAGSLSASRTQAKYETGECQNRELFLFYLFLFS